MNYFYYIDFVTMNWQKRKKRYKNAYSSIKPLNSSEREVATTL